MLSAGLSKWKENIHVSSIGLSGKTSMCLHTYVNGENIHVLSSDLGKWKEKKHPCVVFRLKQMEKKHPYVVLRLK